ncbi:hypothetical protein ANTQUA_LOCUS1400 [Anthophora quadrimaculata]
MAAHCGPHPYHVLSNLQSRARIRQATLEPVVSSIIYAHSYSLLTFLDLNWITRCTCVAGISPLRTSVRLNVRRSSDI